ncbi:MAG: glycerophosphodiester phosphodiesterase, partial [Ilumatobacter sp.]
MEESVSIAARESDLLLCQDRAVGNPNEARPVLLAHRGGAQEGSPNSLEAIRSARAHGAGGVEIDVNESEDGTLFVVHDAVYTTAARWISDLAGHDLPPVDGIEWSRRDLADAVEAASADDLVVYLDLKSIRRTGVERILREWNEPIRAGRMILASTRGEVLAYVAERVPAATTSFLYYDPQLDIKSLASFVRPTYIHPCFDHLRDPLRSVDEHFVERARALDFGLVSWSENDGGRVGRLADLGFDYICTDDLDTATAAI